MAAGRSRAGSSAAGTNLEYASQFNRRVVVEAIRLNGPVSRAELARLTRLSAQTVSNIVAELIGGGLVLQEGRRAGAPGRPTRGQPAIDLVLNPEGACTIGLAIEQDRMTSVLVTLGGAVRLRLEQRLERADPATILPLAVQAVAELERAAGATPLWGIGIAMPGPFEVDAAGFSGPTTLSGWEGLAIAELFADRLDRPVLVERDAAAAARAEFLYGAGKPMRHFFYLHFGVGLGGAFVTDGHPLRGARGNAGEIGLIPAGDGAALENHVSLHALRGRLERAGAMPEAIADPSHPVVAEWLGLAARELRRALRSVENLFDPQSILVGGRLPPSLLTGLLVALTPLDATVADRQARRFPRLTEAVLGADGQALGAAALPVYETLAPDPKSLRKGSADGPVSALRPS